MKTLLMLLFISAIVLPYSRLSYADAKCRSVCYDSYDKCVADIINLPEPRTADEQDTLQACADKRNECEHSCEETNEPTSDQQKQEEAK